MPKIPTPGDYRYPTLGGTIFAGLVLFGIAALIDQVTDLGIWPYVAAALLFGYLVVVNACSVLRLQRRRAEVWGADDVDRGRD